MHKYILPFLQQYLSFISLDIKEKKKALLAIFCVVVFCARKKLGITHNLLIHLKNGCGGL